MKRVSLAVAVALVVAGTQLTLGQGRGNPFIDHSDNGETIHVLPPEATIHNRNATDPTDAPPHQGFRVFSASYGSGNLSSHGGPVMGDAVFKAIYWNSSLASAIQGDIDSFVDTFSDNQSYTSTDKTADFTIVQQYTLAYMLHAGASFTDITHDGQRVPTNYSDGSVRSYIASLFNAGSVAPATDTIYGVYFPSGMRISSQGGGSCSSFCGYHGHFTYNGMDIKYAVFPYTDCRACSLPGKRVVDILTIVTSHEIRETVTDPDLNAWFDNQGYEADDKCAWHNLYQTTTGAHWVQPEYSNGNGGTYPGPGCVVPNQ